MVHDPNQKPSSGQQSDEELSSTEKDVSIVRGLAFWFCLLAFLLGLDLLDFIVLGVQSSFELLIVTAAICSVIGISGYLCLAWASRKSAMLAPLFGCVLSLLFGLGYLGDWLAGETGGRNLRLAIYRGITLLFFIGGYKALRRLREDGQLLRSFPDSEGFQLVAILGFVGVIGGWVIHIFVQILWVTS